MEFIFNIVKYFIIIIILLSLLKDVFLKGFFKNIPTKRRILYAFFLNAANGVAATAIFLWFELVYRFLFFNSDNMQITLDFWPIYILVFVMVVVSLSLIESFIGFEISKKVYSIKKIFYIVVKANLFANFIMLIILVIYFTFR
jgi:hypothetical protein